MIKAVLTGAGLGALTWIFRGPIIVMIIGGFILGFGKAVYNLPSHWQAVSDVEIYGTPVEVAQYKWVVAYRVTNNSATHVVSDISFTCKGGKTIVDKTDLQPGRIYEGTLAVPFAEHLSDCQPHYLVGRTSRD